MYNLYGWIQWNEAELYYIMTVYTEHILILWDTETNIINVTEKLIKPSHRMNEVICKS